MIIEATLSEHLQKHAANWKDIPRYFSSIVPYRTVEPMIRKWNVSNELINQKDHKGRQITGCELGRPTKKQIANADPEKRKILLDQKGVGALVKSDGDFVAYAYALNQYRYTSKDSYFTDLASTVYTLITQDFRNKEVEFIVPAPFSTYVFLSFRGLLKLMFGYAVKENGDAVWGFGKYINEAMRTIMPIILGDEAEPLLFSKVPQYTENGDPAGYKVFSGHPIIIQAVTYNTDGTPDKIAIELSNEFFPIIRELDRKTGEISKSVGNCFFLHTVSSLQTVLRIGIDELKKAGIETKINPATAKKIILCAQAAAECSIFGPEIVQRNKTNNRINVAVRADFIKNVLPDCVSGNGYVNYRAVNERISNAGLMLYHGLKRMGIYEEICKHGKIALLARDRATEFPEDMPNTVFLKFDNVSRINTKKRELKTI